MASLSATLCQRLLSSSHRATCSRVSCRSWNSEVQTLSPRPPYCEFTPNQCRPCSADTGAIRSSRPCSTTLREDTMISSSVPSNFVRTPPSVNSPSAAAILRSSARSLESLSKRASNLFAATRIRSLM